MAKKILVTVTAGGMSNAAPLLELAKILSSRGYKIEFATLSGQERFVNGYDFISRVHSLGSGVADGIEEEKYLSMTDWRNTSLMDDWSPMFEAKKFLESSWPTVYRGMTAIMQDPERRPDFILADYWVDAARDMKVEYDVPIAMHWPQMPTNMLPANYIPGVAGLQLEVLTSENATLWQRAKNELFLIRIFPGLIRYWCWVQKMRSSTGVHRHLPSTTKPDYLLLVNSFFGLEAAKDIPPNVAAVGPILAETYPPLTEQLQKFLGPRDAVLYVSLGTHVLLRDITLRHILEGVTNALNAGYIDGVIWSIRGLARDQFDQNTKAPGVRRDCLTVADILSGQDSNMLFVDFAPQRAILEDPKVCAFVSHAGPASSNEAAFHGIPVISIGVYFDQLQCAMRLRDAGVSIPLDKNTFSAQDVASAVAMITGDPSGCFVQNCKRLRDIARVASRRKYHAADLIEEVLVDHEGRRAGLDRARPMHLQTCDMRMPWWKTRNLDLYACFGGLSLITIGILGLLPSYIMWRWM